MCGPLAQSVEQFPFKEWVASSNLAGLTKNQNNQSFKIVLIKYSIFYKK